MSERMNKYTSPQEAWLPYHPVSPCGMLDTNPVATRLTTGPREADLPSTPLSLDRISWTPTSEMEPLVFGPTDQLLEGIKGPT